MEGLPDVYECVCVFESIVEWVVVDQPEEKDPVLFSVWQGSSPLAGYNVSGGQCLV